MRLSIHSDMDHARVQVSHHSMYTSGWVYYYVSNAMQYSNTALENTSIVLHDSKSFSYWLPLFLMALRIL